MEKHSYYLDGKLMFVDTYDLDFTPGTITAGPKNHAVVYSCKATGRFEKISGVKYQICELKLRQEYIKLPNGEATLKIH